LSRTPGVYVSSTYRDLRDERAVVLEAIERVGAKAIGMEYYGADERRPLEKCVADVRASDLYVGIVGWRAGYCPPETPDRSITLSEYLAAGHAGIPRLVYLSPDIAQWTGEVDEQLDAIRAFRQRVAQEVTAYPFENRTRLALSVSADLARRLQRIAAPEVGDHSLLPYLCDRTPQCEVVVDLLSSSAGRSPVCLLHGDRDQSLSKFIDCLRDVQLPGWLRAEGHPVLECRLDWPEGPLDRVSLRIRQGLARALALDVRTARDADLVASIAAHPSPVVITLQIPTDGWTQKQADVLERLVAYFAAWPAREPAKPDLILLWAEYPSIRPSPLRFLGHKSASEQHYEQAVRGIEGLSRQAFTLLPRAESVGRYDATNWARLTHVKRATAGRDLEYEIGRLYAERQRIPMEELGRALLLLLQRPHPEVPSDATQPQTSRGP
jgi:hypothetical protein